MDSNLNLAFRPAEHTQEDAALFCSLSNTLYARKVDHAYYIWQFFETPFPALLTFAFVDSQYVGCYAYQIRYTRRSGEKLGMAIDIMIAPQFQGRGLFRALANAAQLRLQPLQPVVLFVMPNERAEAAHVLGLGWRRVGVMTNWVCRTFESAAPPEAEFTFQKIERLEAVDTAFLKSVECPRSSGMAFAFRRDADWLEWRFLRNPRYRYVMFRCMELGEEVGIMTLKSFRDPLSGNISGDIVDVIWKDENAALASGMLRFALGYFHSQGISEAATWLHTNTNLDDAGSRLGFQATGQKRYLCCHVVDKRYQWMEEPRNWSITMADAEVY